MGKRRFPKKEGIVFKLSYGGGVSGSQPEPNPNNEQKDNKGKKPSSVVEEEVTEEEEAEINSIPKQKPARSSNSKAPKDDEYDEDELEEIGSDDEIEEGAGGSDIEEDEDFDDEGSGSEDGPKRNNNKNQSQFNKRKPEELDYDELLAFGSDDDYDYKQHIREPGRGVFIGADLDYTEKVLHTLNLGHKVKKLREMAGTQFIDVDDIQDKEVDAALFGTEDGTYYAGTLDDDFVAQANGGAPVDMHEVEMARLRRSVNKVKIRDVPLTDARALGAQAFDDDGFFDDDDDFDVDATKYIGTNMEGDADRKPRLIDEQFDHLLDKYDEANFGEYTDPRDPEVMGQHEVDIDDPIFQEYLEARKNRKGPAQTPASFNYDEEVGVDKENIKPVEPEEITAEEPEVESEGEDPLAGIYPAKKVEQWDCDTIISTYSNLENHPKLIVEPSNKIKLSKKTGMPLGVLGTRQKDQKEASDDEEDESDEVSITENTGKARSRDETPEQRKERKKQLKEAKQANREKKKLVKQAYKNEELKQTNLMVAQRVNQRVVYKF